MKYKIDGQDEFQKLAKDFVEKLVPNNSGATVVGLYGELGAGKTFFTGALAKIFKIQDPVVSPTFVIEKIYELPENSQNFLHLIHIDAYRLETSEELLNLGWKNIISDKNNLILIEWPEKVSDIMPEHIKIRIKHAENENSREVEIVV